MGGDEQVETLVVVLGSPNAPDGTLYSIARERAAKGVEVFRRNSNAKLVLTGGHGEHFNKAKNAHHHYMRAHLLDLGIPEDAIIATIDSGNTYEDSSLMTDCLDKYEPKRVILVTSDFHIPRALFVFRRDHKDKSILFEAEGSITDIENCDLDIKHLCEHEINSMARLTGSQE